jgi:PBP4 family serine-type D-alanyl-D-alanine carboxypeptidase
MVKVRALAAALAAVALLGVGCTADDGPGTAGPSGSTGGGSTSAPPGSALDDGAAALPADIRAIMEQPRYDEATWSLLVTDVETGETFYSQNADELSFTGSTRKLFSVGLALDTLGADHRQETPVHRIGDVGPDGTLDGDLVLVGGGDLTFGGRRDGDTIAFTNFDHNDANNLGTSGLTPQDPLTGVNDLARQVRDAGITSIDGDVVVDDRFFEPYVVPNGNLLITPVILNENMVDVTITPTEPGQPARVEYRPETGALLVDNQVMTGPAGSESTVELSDRNRITCIGTPGCTGTITGSIPADYAAPFTGEGAIVATFRVEEPNAFMRTAFIEALQREGVTVTAAPVAANPDALLPEAGAYPADTRVATYTSAPYDQTARLVLKVSLNLGANLSLSLFGLDDGERTVDGSLAAERTALTERFGLDPASFDFPTNGSGSPDSRATPTALVRFLIAMQSTPVAEWYQQALPILGVDGSLATSGTDLPGAGHVFAKTGTTVEGNDAGGVELVAQNLAGYIETKSGRLVAYALLVNGVGELASMEEDLGAVIADEAAISSLLYENL